MKSTRHKPRYLSEEDLAADHAMRKAVRAVLRERFPDLERPSGQDWLMAPAAQQCPVCDAWMLIVRVRDAAAVQLGYCPDCVTAFLWDELV